MKPEDRLLFLCTRQTFTDDHLHALLDLCRRQPIQWEDVFFTAKQHAVAPLVGANLERAIAAGLEVPPDIVHKFQLATIRNVAAKGKRTEKLAKVLAFLSARSIAAMAVKSAAVDLLVYEQPWYTTAADTDLILRLREPKVPIEQAELPCSATGGVACPDADRHRGAASAGKSPEPEVSDQTHAELAHFFYQKATEFEFYDHHDVTMDGVLPVDFGRIWRDARAISFEGYELYLMSLEDMLLSLCINSGRKRFFRLRSLVDIAETVNVCRELDWTLFSEKAIAYQCNNIAFSALLATQTTLRCDLPAGVLDSLAVGRVRAAFLHRLIPVLVRHLSLSALSFYTGRDLLGRKLGWSLVLPYATYGRQQVGRKIKVLRSE